MKKVLSLVLAVMMVVGMSTTAFADFDVTTAVTAEQNWGTIVRGEAVSKTVDIPAQGANTLNGITFAVTADNNSTYDVSALDALFTAVTVDDVYEAQTKATISFKLGANLPAGDYNIAATLTDSASPPNSIAINKITFTLEDAEEEETTTGDPKGYVDSKYKITGFSDSAASAWESISEDKVRAGDEFKSLKIVPSMFTWVDKNKVAWTPDDSLTIRSSQLSNVGIRRVYQKNTAGTVETVDLKDSKANAHAYVLVEMVEFYTKTKSTDVELKVALTFKGSTKKAPEAELNLTINNDEEFIEDGQTETSSYGNIFLKAEDTVRNVEFQGDADEIVWATKTVVKGQKYYFNATTKLTKEDEQIIADNPEVDSIYNVYQNNMANATVQFKNLDREFFVYDQDGKLLGTTKDKKLPLAGKYILTTAKVDFGGEEVVEEPVEETPDVDAPPMGGGEVPPSNNYNPNTGL